MIRLEHIYKRFGSRLILKDVNASFKRGEISLIVGENGAGKSTLLRIVAGLSSPASGKVIEEEEIALGFLGHETFLYPALTALENLRFWQAAAHKDCSKKTLLAMLQRVGLGNVAQLRAGTFSRGMQQRLSLARVLLSEANLLLLDEPSTGLDSASKSFLEQEILAARARDACIVWISHDTEHDMQIADRVLAIQQKKLVLLSSDPKQGEKAC